MTQVKAEPRRAIPADERHAPMMMGLLMQELRAVYAAEDWNGLRQSHFRVISSVPPEGISITELAERVGMTKQGVGQFVTQLVDGGYLQATQDPADRRTRIVTRTTLGRRTIRKVTSRNLRLEREWARRVGPQRYAEFRAVLEELAHGG